jgi:RNA polymerase sigma-70 factor, ECF subfamily
MQWILCIDRTVVLESESTDSATWLARFHAGERDVMETCYREHFERVNRTVGRILTGADRETVVHEVFFRLLSEPRMRMGFSGGSLGAWLATVARNQAVDFVRKQGREVSIDPDVVDRVSQDRNEQAETKAEARLLIERFRRDHLPAKWIPVFEARFLRQLSQREAARELGIYRTTLAYQEMQIRKRLRRFVLGGGKS